MLPEHRKSIIRVLFSRRILVAFLMGFSSGLPLLLTIGVLQAWMKEEGVDLTWIGMITLVQLPYTWKFIWAPVLDRYTLPFLGRRRGWLLVAQLCLIASITALGYSDPVRYVVPFKEHLSRLRGSCRWMSSSVPPTTRAGVVSSGLDRSRCTRRTSRSNRSRRRFW